MKRILENPYIKILRTNHWFKNLFLVIGVLAGMWSSRSFSLSGQATIQTLAAFFLASFVSSANYIINQVVDAKFDILHPTKKHRIIPSGKISVPNATVLSVILFVAAIYFSVNIFSLKFVLTLFSLWVAGLVYNLPPVRLKDIPFVDVLSESVNNPIRFLLGWFIIAPFSFPPLPLLLFTWATGAVLMTAKRYNELLVFGAHLFPYRSTFKVYSLLILKKSLIFYCLLSFFTFIYFSSHHAPNLLIGIPLILISSKWFITQVISGRVSIP